VILLIKALIKEFPLCWTSFYIYFYNYLDLATWVYLNFI